MLYKTIHSCYDFRDWSAQHNVINLQLYQGKSWRASMYPKVRPLSIITLLFVCSVLGEYFGQASNI